MVANLEKSTTTASIRRTLFYYFYIEYVCDLIMSYYQPTILHLIFVLCNVFYLKIVACHRITSAFLTWHACCRFTIADLRYIHTYNAYTCIFIQLCILFWSINNGTSHRRALFSIPLVFLVGYSSLSIVLLLLGLHLNVDFHSSLKKYKGSC